MTTGISVKVKPLTTIVTSVVVGNNSSTGTSVRINPIKSILTSSSIVPSSNITLASLTDVDTNDADDGEVLLYDAANTRYVIAPIEVDSNNITNIQGGSF